MKVHLRMLGCRLNQSEIDHMARQLSQLGHEIVTDPAQADHFIVNTCTVTTQAAKDGRKLIRELNRTQSAAEITVTGCYAQISPDEITVLPGVKQVIGNREKESLVETLTGEKVAPYDLEPAERDAFPGGRTRAFIKVQDGCDNQCTFCITTVARGEGRSRPQVEIIHEIQQLHQHGYQEAVLTGVHLGSYGHDWGDGEALVKLVQAILTETDIPRLRLSSLEPWDLAPDFFNLWQNTRVCPHLHLPLQSGCDRTLKRMARNTNQNNFRTLVTEARAAIPDLRLTSDVIVGFPGETDEEFAISETFIQEMDFNGLHVFRYSRRAGTPADRMNHHVSPAVKKERSQRLLTWAKEQEHHFASQHLGQTRQVLWEQVIGATPKGFKQVGYTDNYMRVSCIHPRDLTNHITLTHLLELESSMLQGEAVIE